jgi:hypothetical protein
MDLLTTYTNDSELKAIKAPPPNLHDAQIATERLNLFAAYCVFTSPSLATASNNGDSSASRAQVVSP